MKNKDNTWLSISIFIPKSKRHILIKNGIKPFIYTLLSEHKLLSFKIIFDNLSGENIRLSLLVISESAPVIAQLTDQYFNDFLIKERLFSFYSEGPYNSVFMPHLNNSIQYGLYSTTFNSDYLYLQDLDQAFSTLMIEAFSEDDFDDETILTFAMYVLFDCYKLIRNTSYDFAKKCGDYFNHLSIYSILNEDNYKLIQDQYEELDSTIDEIYFDVINSRAKNDLNWINIWDEEFVKTWQKVKNNNNDAAALVNNICSLINKHLGFDINTTMLLNVFVSKTLAKHNSEIESN